MIDDSASRARARLMLMDKGYQYIQQPDWIAEKDGEWTFFEIKEKDLFTPGRNFPHFGYGLDISQIFLRKKAQGGLTPRTYLLCFVKDKPDVYGSYIDELEAKGGYYDTPSKIRIYPLTSFDKWPDLTEK